MEHTKCGQRLVPHINKEDYYYGLSEYPIINFWYYGCPKDAELPFNGAKYIDINEARLTRSRSQRKDKVSINKEDCRKYTESKIRPYANCILCNCNYSPAPKAFIRTKDYGLIVSLIDRHSDPLKAGGEYAEFFAEAYYNDFDEFIENEADSIGEPRPYIIAEMVKNDNIINLSTYLFRQPPTGKEASKDEQLEHELGKHGIKQGLIYRAWAEIFKRPYLYTEYFEYPEKETLPEPEPINIEPQEKQKLTTMKLQDIACYIYYETKGLTDTVSTGLTIDEWSGADVFLKVLKEKHNINYIRNADNSLKTELYRKVDTVSAEIDKIKAGGYSGMKSKISGSTSKIRVHYKQLDKQYPDCLKEVTEKLFN